MPRMMVAGIAALAIFAMLAPTAMAEESSPEAAYRSVAQAQEMLAVSGMDAFEQISGSDAFDPFVFVFGTDDFVTVASSDFPDLEGTVTLDPYQSGYTHQSMLEILAQCDGFWAPYHFEPEPGMVLVEMLWFSETDGYVFGSGFFLPNSNLPWWLHDAHDNGQLERMAMLLNTAAGCPAANTGKHIMDMESPMEPEVRTVGVLVPDTGTVPSFLSRQVHGAIDFALDEFNGRLAETNADWRLELVKRDTRSDPAQTLALVEELDDMGIKAILGPATSQNLREIQDYLAANDMVAISYASGASDLSIPGDRIFRTVADAATHAQAQHSLLRHDGIEEVIMVFYDDAIGQSINHTLYEAVESDAGIHMRDSIKFSPGELLPVAEQIISSFAADPPIDDYTRVGVAFFDYTGLMVEVIQRVANSDVPGLDDARWYGSDHLMTELHANEVTKPFLVETGYQTLTLTYRENALNIRLDSLVADSGIYGYAAYDALFIMGNAVDIVGSATDGPAIAGAIPEAARIGHGPDETSGQAACSAGELGEYAGALGASVDLNEAGDLAGSDYTVALMEDGGYTVTHLYDSVTGDIRGFNLPEKVSAGVAVTGDNLTGAAVDEMVGFAEYCYNLDLAKAGADWRIDLSVDDVVP